MTRCHLEYLGRPLHQMDRVDSDDRLIPVEAIDQVIAIIFDGIQDI